MVQWENDHGTNLESPTINRTIEAAEVRMIEMPGQNLGYE